MWKWSKLHLKFNSDERESRGVSKNGKEDWLTCMYTSLTQRKINVLTCLWEDTINLLRQGATKEGESTLRQKVGDVSAVFLSVYISKGSL